MQYDYGECTIDQWRSQLKGRLRPGHSFMTGESFRIQLAQDKAKQRAFVSK
jgi:hypothetical protein